MPGGRGDCSRRLRGLVHRAQRAGLRTALLSNSWGNDYPRDGWDEMFDVVVISGEVGMRKPDARIYQLSLERLGASAERTAFVDDAPGNVEGARRCGLQAVLIGPRPSDEPAAIAALRDLLG